MKSLNPFQTVIKIITIDCRTFFAQFLPFLYQIATLGLLLCFICSSKSSASARTTNPHSPSSSTTYYFQQARLRVFTRWVPILNWKDHFATLTQPFIHSINPPPPYAVKCPAEFSLVAEFSVCCGLLKANQNSINRSYSIFQMVAKTFFPFNFILIAYGQ